VTTVSTKGSTADFAHDGCLDKHRRSGRLLRAAGADEQPCPAPKKLAAVEPLGAAGSFCLTRQ
jgi:hypothetical protein